MEPMQLGCEARDKFGTVARAAPCKALPAGVRSLGISVYTFRIALLPDSVGFLCCAFRPLYVEFH